MGRQTQQNIKLIVMGLDVFDFFSVHGITYIIWYNVSERQEIYPPWSW